MIPNLGIFIFTLIRRHDALQQALLSRQRLGQLYAMARGALAGQSLPRACTFISARWLIFLFFFPIQDLQVLLLVLLVLDVLFRLNSE